MRLEKSVELSSGILITVKEITPTIWNNLCRAKGESLLEMSLAKVMEMELSELKNLAADMVVMPEETTILDLGYTGLIEAWSAWREVNESFLSLLTLAQENKPSLPKEAPVNQDA